MRGELVPEVAPSLGLSDQSGRWAVASLSNYLQARQLLLAYALLRSCPELRIIATGRVREEAHRRDARHGAITGLAATCGVITSAGFVLAGTVAVLATIPSTFTTELGFAVAFGIVSDTIIVRPVLVTALYLDLGLWMWWPSKLARTSGPGPAELGHEPASALTGA